MGADAPTSDAGDGPAYMKGKPAFIANKDLNIAGISENQHVPKRIGDREFGVRHGHLTQVHQQGVFLYAWPVAESHSRNGGHRKHDQRTSLPMSEYSVAKPCAGFVNHGRTAALTFRNKTGYYGLFLNGHGLKESHAYRVQTTY